MRYEMTDGVFRIGLPGLAANLGVTHGNRNNVRGPL